MYLTKKDINQRIFEEKNENKKLFIRPLLDINQIGEISIDLRLGTDFLVSAQGRDAFINASFEKYSETRNINGFFVPTRRKIGHTILLHPHQTILCSTLEYVKFPNDVFATISPRSSYSRLGLTLATIVQPGYVGCISLELTNQNNNPIKITVGSRIIQARLHKVENESDYGYSNRKYVCQVRPTVAKIHEDEDLKLLNSIAEKY